MKTFTVDIEGWPEPFVQLLEQVAEHLASKARGNGESVASIDWPRWPGIAPPPEAMRRVEIYKHVR
ncbi:MAG: hypothetical protein AMXMBFR13_23040 [Phycisphaerae bacterium]|jgi:hypothetical protein